MVNDETKHNFWIINITKFISTIDLNDNNLQLISIPFGEWFQMAFDLIYQEKYDMK